MNKRYFELDVLRILACYLVILNHTLWTFHNYQGNVTWFISAILFFTSKIAVPLFLMISGALLLPKERDYRHFVLKKVSQTVAILCVCSFAFLLFFKPSALQFNALGQTLFSLIQKPVVIDFWYLYLMIGLYITSPFLSKMVRQFNQKDAFVFTVVWGVFATILPFIGYLFPFQVSNYVSVPLATGWVGYFILGYVLHQMVIPKSHLKWYGLSFISALGFVIWATMQLSKGKTALNFDNIYFFPIAIMAISIFLLVKNLFSNNTKINVPKWVNLVSQTTFSTYLLQAFFIRFIKKCLGFKRFSNNCYQIISV